MWITELNISGRIGTLWIDFLSPFVTILLVKIKPRSYDKNGKSAWVVDLRRWKQGRFFFESKKDAENFAAEKKTEFETLGTTSLSMQPGERDDALVAKSILAGKATLTQAAIHYIATHKSSEKKRLSDAKEEYISSKSGGGKRANYINKLRSVLKNFISGREEVFCHEIKQVDIERYIFEKNWKLVTKSMCLRDIRYFFSFALHRGWCATDPCTGLSEIKYELKSPAIFTPEQCRQLLDRARSTPKMRPIIPYLALALFCGIRPEEIKRLTWNDIKMDRNIVEIKHAASKTRQRRIVTINPTARAWLELGGSIPPPVKHVWSYLRQIHTEYKKVDGKTVKKAIIPWSHDVLRHSFCSYACATWGASKTAAEAGHSEAMLFKHYREVVSKEDAEKFWSILP